MSEEQEFLRETTRKFLETELPLSRVRELADHPDGFERAAWKRAADLGFSSMLVPEGHGGGSLGGGLMDLAIVAEEVGRACSPGPLLPTNVVAAAIAERGTSAQCGRWLPGIANGDLIASWAVIEAGGAWRPHQLALEARRSGDGFVLRGSKQAVEAGAQADCVLVTARTERGLSQFLVPRGAAGVRTAPQSGLDLVRRYATLHFEDVPVPSDTLLGREGGAEADVVRQLQLASVLQCAESAGAAAAVFGTALAYMFDRFSFGRPLASYQALKHRFADMKMWLEASHAISHGAARAVQARSKDAAELACAAKSYVGEKAIAIIQDCIQMHGGMGVTWEHDAHLYLRRVTQNRVLYGSPAEHREWLASCIGMDEGGGAAQ